MLLLLLRICQIVDEDVARLVRKSIPSVPEIHDSFTAFSFTPRILDYDETPAVVLAMAKELGFIDRYLIKYNTKNLVFFKSFFP